MIGLGVAGALAINSPAENGVRLNSLAPTLQVPLSTQAAQIVDATQTPVKLRGVNWFGIETELHAPHGLWARDYKTMLAQIKQLGYNSIRLPFSVASLQATEVSGIDFSLGSNAELAGKTPLEVMDLIIQEAERQGLLVLLDCHRLNDQRIPELWYGDGFTEIDWLSTWIMLARRYRHQANVIGADLKNEPHGRASWGTGDRNTDWRLAAERAGNAILAVNPDWLIVVEGVENNVPGQQLAVHWQGGNLEGAGRFPVRLSVPNKLVYSPHEYGPGVFEQPWFSDPDFPNNLRDRWEIGFHYLATQGIAPVLIGEFGGRGIDTTSTEGIWQRSLINFIAENHLSFAYWSWNPNSEDTGGLLQDDWQQVDLEKQALLDPLLDIASLPPAADMATPGDGPSSPPALETSQADDRMTGLQATAQIQSDWQSGFCLSVQVRNLGRRSVDDWRLTFEMNQAQIRQSWNGDFQQQDSQYEVIPPAWGQPLHPNQGVDLGFCADKTGADYRPRSFSVKPI